MDRQTQEYLDSLLNKLPLTLTPDEVAFLRARRSYLNPMQLQIFAEVLQQPGEILIVDSVRFVETADIKDPTDDLIREEIAKPVQVKPVKKTNKKKK